MLTLNMQAPKASDSPQHKKRGTAADLRIRLSQDWPRVGTASPPKRENILTPQKATYKGGKARTQTVSPNRDSAYGGSRGLQASEKAAAQVGLNRLRKN